MLDFYVSDVNVVITASVVFTITEILDYVTFFSVTKTSDNCRKNYFHFATHFINTYNRIFSTRIYQN